MINLIELEKKLDLVLANETSESLTNWIVQKRIDSYLRNNMGEGTLINARHKPEKLTIMQEKKVDFDSQFCVLELNNFTLQAA